MKEVNEFSQRFGQKQTGRHKVFHGDQLRWNILLDNEDVWAKQNQWQWKLTHLDSIQRYLCSSKTNKRKRFKVFAETNPNLHSVAENIPTRLPVIPAQPFLDIKPFIFIFSFYVSNIANQFLKGSFLFFSWCTFFSKVTYDIDYLNNHLHPIMWICVQSYWGVALSLTVVFFWFWMLPFIFNNKSNRIFSAHP